MLLLSGGVTALTVLAPALRAADYYILPAAAGSGDGSSWANAAAAPSTDAWSDQVAKLTAGDTLRIGSGTYEKATIAIAKGGAKGAPVTLQGEDTGGGLPVFRSSWVKETPASGGVFCRLAVNAAFVTLKDLRFENYLAVFVTSGGNEGIVLSGLDVKDVRFGAVFKNNARADDPASWTRDVLVENSTFTGFTKSALRWEGGNRDFRIVNVHGDAGGKAYAGDPFHMIYDIRGDTRKDITDPAARTHEINLTFIGCTARNAYHEAPPGKSYWNGDGFVAERGVSNLTFIDCMAFDCTDGGWDLKATNVTFKGCVAFRNKRNFRLWSEATFENCIAGYPVHRGGSGDSANLGAYGKGVVTMDRCTLVGDPTPFNIEVKGAAPGAIHIRMKDSLVISDGASAPQIKQADLVNTLVFPLDSAPKGPVFAAEAISQWDGKGTAFNPVAAYGNHGFRRSPAR
ncbi:MAG: hypothetical protein ABII82_16240 [Verrucomicrobiota bacterium]